MLARIVSHGRATLADRETEVVASVLHRAGDPWLNIQPQLVAEIDRGKAVMWVSFSGTVQLFAKLEDQVIRVRQGDRSSPHPGDGLGVLVPPPFFATACGFGDASGYRSTPPLLVVTVQRAADVVEQVEHAMTWGKQFAAGHDLDWVPPGHPPDPCGAMHCPRIVPGAVPLENG